MIILVLLLTFKVLFLLFPTTVLTAAREGLFLWLNNVMPALLPFMIVTNMLIATGFARHLGNLLAPVMRRVFGLPGAGGFAFVIGLTSGYPLGAKTVADLHKNGELTTQDAQHLLAFCNNAGPLFILGVVGVGFFENVTMGYVLWAGHVLAAVVVGVLLRGKADCVTASRALPVTNVDIGKVLDFSGNQRRRVKMFWNQGAFSRVNSSFRISLLGDSVKNAMESMAVIGGLIIFFNAVVAVLGEIGLPDSGMLAGIMAGAVEVTSGVRKISYIGVSAASVGATAFAIAFGGFSIHMQTFHFTEGTGISAKKYLLCKILHGVVAAVISVFLWVWL